MPGDDWRAQLNNAVEQAIVGEADLDEIEDELAEAQLRIDEVRTFRGESA